jgi:hypothetical protein
MLKKYLIPIMIIISFISVGFNSFASSIDTIYNKNTKDTSQCMISIWRPDGNETTSSKSIKISGQCKKHSSIIKVLVYNPKTDTYQEHKSFEVGSWGVFAKVIELPYNGVNKIRIVAISENTREYTLGKTLQISSFYIIQIKEGAKSDFFSFAGMLNQFFKK